MVIRWKSGAEVFESHYRQARFVTIAPLRIGAVNGEGPDFMGAIAGEVFVGNVGEVFTAEDDWLGGFTHPLP